jgi:heat shock protein HslJ
LLNEPITTEKLVGTYTATLPCADCQEIAYEITFKDNGAFSELATYVGKEKVPHQTIGFYTITADNKVNLGKYTKAMNLLGLTAEGLLMLDVNGDIITGPLAGKYLLKRQNEEIEEITSTKKDNAWYWEERIDFYSAPNTEGWYLHLGIWGEVVFSAPDGTIYKTQPTEFVLGENQYTMTMECSDTWGSLVIEINSAQRCLHHQSGDQYDAFLTLTFTPTKGSKKTFEDCGNFTVHPELNEQLWQLASINNVAAEEARYERGAPQLNFDIYQRQFRGHDGCNEVGGGWTVNGGKISFGQFASTALSCPDMAASRDFNFALQHETYSYVIYDELLTLTSPRNTIVFTKVD